ncbi:MAG: TonB-dependent receptor [Saprospiraceae bacterium]|nr:TonB-dependent receptor [Saprospiraceae bacterium]
MKKFLPILAVFLYQHALAQSPVILSGSVKDNSGNSVIGATAQIIGTHLFGVTDLDGKFEIELIDKLPPFQLEVRSVGYNPQIIEVLDQNQIILSVLVSDNAFEEVTVTARRRKEALHQTPIPITVLDGAMVEKTGANNVNRVKELVPSVQLYSSNPRNTGLNIRGLGSTFGLTNDGLDPGVGFYVDGVYMARPAATAIDFIDVEQIEVLRGPQGTLFGKNTTAGAFNITSRKPTFQPTGKVEVGFGNFGLTQAKASISGPLSKHLAARISLSGNKRNGTLYHTTRDEYVNDQNNIGLKSSFLYDGINNTEIFLSADYSKQQPNGYAQVVAGIVETAQPAFRQFPAIISDLNYQLPSNDPFDRIIDHDIPWRSNNEYGGVSLTAETRLALGKLTSISAFRFWNWRPSNDRDFTGLEALSVSAAPSSHQQWSQEFSYSAQVQKKLHLSTGVFAIWENLKPIGAHIQESGKDQWRFSQNNNDPLWKTPGLLDGYGLKSYPFLQSFSGAVFTNLDWKLSEKWHLVSGIRANSDIKDVSFNSEVYGGLQTDDPKLIALQRRVYSPQSFEANVRDQRLSGMLALSYFPVKSITAYLNLSSNFKPVGVNLGGLPRENGEVLTDLAIIKPERVYHAELGIKSSSIKNTITNLTIFRTQINNYQTLVQTADLALNRGYLANAGQVSVLGAELESSYRWNDVFNIQGALSYTDGKYDVFTNAPPPLEEVGTLTYKDISGGVLPGISKWAGSLSGEYAKDGKWMTYEGKYFIGVDFFYRSSFSSNASPSKYLNVDGYGLAHMRLGFRDVDGVTIFGWVRNITNTQYFEQLLVAGGNAGHYAGVLGDPRTYGITLKYNW